MALAIARGRALPPHPRHPVRWHTRCSGGIRRSGRPATVACPVSAHRTLVWSGRAFAAGCSVDRACASGISPDGTTRRVRSRPGDPTPGRGRSRAETGSGPRRRLPRSLASRATPAIDVFVADRTWMLARPARLELTTFRSAHITHGVGCGGSHWCKNDRGHERCSHRGGQARSDHPRSTIPRHPRTEHRPMSDPSSPASRYTDSPRPCPISGATTTASTWSTSRAPGQRSSGPSSGS